MAIDLKTIDIILATASVVIFIIVFFFVFQFRKLNKKTRDQEKEVEESVVALPVEIISENIRDAAPEQIKMPETADLKLEEILPEQTISSKPEIAEILTGVPENELVLKNELPEKPADIEPPEHENETPANVELKLEDELPEKSADVETTGLKIEISESTELKLEDTIPEKASDIEDSFLKTEMLENAELRLEDELPQKLSEYQTAQIADTVDALTENSGASIRVDGHAIDIPKTTKPNKRSARKKKTDDKIGGEKSAPRKKAVRKTKSTESEPKKIEKKKSTRKSKKPKKKERMVPP
jgi:hypothetical protein